MRMTMSEFLETYKSDSIEYMPNDLVRTDVVMVWIESKNFWQSAIFIDYSNEKVIAVRDDKNASDIYKQWFTLSTNEPVVVEDPTGGDGNEG